MNVPSLPALVLKIQQLTKENTKKTISFKESLSLKLFFIFIVSYCWGQNFTIYFDNFSFYILTKLKNSDF